MSEQRAPCPVAATGGRTRWGWSDIGRGWPLLLLGGAAIAMYTTLYLEPRYIAPFVVMVWLGALLVLDPSLTAPWRRGLFSGAAVVLLLGTLPGLTPKGRALLPGYRNQHGDDAAFVLSSCAPRRCGRDHRRRRVRVLGEARTRSSRRGDPCPGEPGLLGRDSRSAAHASGQAP